MEEHIRKIKLKGNNSYKSKSYEQHNMSNLNQSLLTMIKRKCQLEFYKHMNRYANTVELQYYEERNLFPILGSLSQIPCVSVIYTCTLMYLIQTYPSATNNWNRKLLKLKMFSICYLIPVIWTLFLIREIPNRNWATLQQIFNVLIWVLHVDHCDANPLGFYYLAFPWSWMIDFWFILVDECTFLQVTNNHHQYVSWQIRQCCFQIAIKADTDKTCRDVSLIREARVIIINLHRDDQEWQTSVLSTAKKKKKPGRIHVHLITQINSS